MKRCKRNLTASGLWILGSLVLFSCAGGLPPSLQRDISAENDSLQSAESRLHRSDEELRKELAEAPDLFANASEPGLWTAAMRSAQQKLDEAKNDSRTLERLEHERGQDVVGRANRVLAEERSLRLAAAEQARGVESAAGEWLAFRRDVPASLGKMRHEYEAIRAADLTSLAAVVEHAGQDWPAKKQALESRLTALQEIPKNAEAQWSRLEPARQDAAAGKASGAQLATLIEGEHVLSQEQATLAGAPAAMSSLIGQLYDSWDKILTDLDTGHYGEDNFYRERLKTVRTHLLDGPSSSQSQTTSDEHWTNVSEPAFHSVENDLGMTIAHKDVGLFDSEAQTTPQPAGFAYVATPEQGSNSYGYWNHAGGASVWTFLPQYLLMRELLWNHDYRPVYVNEYSAYRAAQRSGATYYGRPTPTSPPKYGSHGTFTQTHYADSRYVQSGGFKNSAYASHSGGSPSGVRSAQAQPHGVSTPDENSSGHRFGRQPGSAAPQRFGRPGGFRPFGGRSFGRRR